VTASSHPVRRPSSDVTLEVRVEPSQPGRVETDLVGLDLLRQGRDVREVARRRHAVNVARAPPLGPQPMPARITPEPLLRSGRARAGGVRRVRSSSAFTGSITSRREVVEVASSSILSAFAARRRAPTPAAARADDAEEQPRECPAEREHRRPRDLTEPRCRHVGKPEPPGNAQREQPDEADNHRHCEPLLHGRHRRPPTRPIGGERS
jgi:hypothetical protein